MASRKSSSKKPSQQDVVMLFEDSIDEIFSLYSLKRGLYYVHQLIVILNTAHVFDLFADKQFMCLLFNPGEQINIVEKIDRLSAYFRADMYRNPHKIAKLASLQDKLDKLLNMPYKRLQKFTSREIFVTYIPLLINLYKIKELNSTPLDCEEIGGNWGNRGNGGNRGNRPNEQPSEPEQSSSAQANSEYDNENFMQKALNRLNLYNNRRQSDPVKKDHDL